MIKLAYLKVQAIHDLALAMDLLSSGRVSKAIEVTKRALELMERYEKALEEVGK